MPEIRWSIPQPLALSPPLTAPVLAEILDGGQAFRWHRETVPAARQFVRRGDGAGGSPREAGPASPAWLGCFDRFVVRLSLDSAGTLLWSAPVLSGNERPAALAAATASALARYFDTARDAGALADTLPWRSDPHLARCLAAFPGLRILRQPFGETLLAFLCSATKQIVQIKQMLAHLAVRHGSPLTELVAPDSSPRPGAAEAGRLPAPPKHYEGGPAPFHRLPTWPALAAVSERDLRACRLGFRARYIHQTAQFLARHPGWLDETEALPYPAARERLCSLPGVGEKVADCVLLFGAGKLEAFPVDTWIIRTMAGRYGLPGWKPAQIARFGRTHFGPLAGLAQQYLFACERLVSRRPALPASVI